MDEYWISEIVFGNTVGFYTKGKFDKPRIRGQWVRIRGQWVRIRGQWVRIRTQ